MKAIILEAISRHNFTFDELNTFLFNHNKEIFEHVCEKAIAYFDDYAPQSLSPVGIEYVRAMTSLHCSFSRH